MTPSAEAGAAAAPAVPAPEHIARAIDGLLARRAADASICPSEVARQLDPGDWRRLMQPVRDVAAQLARAGRLQITRKGQTLPVDLPWRGAIRLRRPPCQGPDR